MVNVSRRKCAHLAVQELSQFKQAGEVSNAMGRLVARQVANSLKVVTRIWHACFLEATVICEIRIEDMYRRMKTRLYMTLGECRVGTEPRIGVESSRTVYYSSS